VWGEVQLYRLLSSLDSLKYECEWYILGSAKCIAMAKRKPRDLLEGSNGVLLFWLDRRDLPFQGYMLGRLI